MDREIQISFSLDHHEHLLEVHLIGVGLRRWKVSSVSDLTVRLESDEGVRERLDGVTSGGFDQMAHRQIDRIVSDLTIQ
jgi:hypothetical protein